MHFGGQAATESRVVCDRDEQKARKLASRFGIERVFTDAETMLTEMPDDELLQFVAIDLNRTTHE